MSRSDARNDSRMPVLFVGHGSPMNAIEDNRWSRGFRAIGDALPRPRAVLCISAHWWADAALVTGTPRPPTIHDFGGFPQPLYEIDYPAPGSPDLAARVADLLAAHPIERPGIDDARGLDHGAWSVLRHLLPEADVPVVQLALDARLDPHRHFELARPLITLRDDGVLVLASGNITHDLRDARDRLARGETDPPDWARRFDRDVARALQQHDHDHLVRAWPDGRDARRVHPHPDHWLPLLYATAATDPDDDVGFPLDGFDWGSLSMRAVRWG